VSARETIRWTLTRLGVELPCSLDDAERALRQAEEEELPEPITAPLRSLVACLRHAEAYARDALRAIEEET